MKIIFLCHYFHPRIGGVEKHVFRVAEELIRQGHEIVVITSQYTPDLLTHDQIDGIKIYRIKLPGNHWQRPSKIQLWKWMVKHRNLFKPADIIHCHDVFFWYLPLRFLLPFKPIFTTFHGYEGKCPPDKKSIFIRKISEKLSFGNLCVGKYLEKWYGTHASEITYGATEIPSKIPSPKSKTSAVFIGRIDQDTGIPQYLETIDLLNKQGIKLKVEFCGDGPLRNQAQKRGRVLGFQKDITGPLSRNRFAFVSSYLCILEAMAHHRLVFAVYDNDLKRDTLLMSPFLPYINISSSSTNLARQIKEALAGPNLEREMVDQAYKWVKIQTWQQLTQKYVNLWQTKS